MGIKNWIVNKISYGIRGVEAAKRRQRLQDTRLQDIRGSFDSAATTTDNSRHWVHADNLTADQAASPGVRMTLRNRARYEVANNSYARGILDTYSADLVGGGPMLQMQTSNKKFNAMVEQAWTKWAEEIDLAAKLNLASLTKKESGEMFGQMFTNGGLENPVKLDMRLLEADRIEQPTFQGERENELDGIKYDRWGNPSEYYVLDQPLNPLFGVMGGKYTTVPRKWMIHWYRADRPGQHRGLPEIMAALPLFADLRRYTLAVIGAAEIAADMNVILETNAQANVEVDLVEPMDTLPLERNMITAAPAGYTARQMRAEQPTQTYGDFKRNIVNEIARCISQPANIAGGDSSGYNFASGRLDHMTYDMILTRERKDLVRKVLERLFRAWAEEWGLIAAAGFDGFAPPGNTWELKHSWVWVPRKHADPEKEAKAEKLKLENKTTSRQAEVTRNGGDFDALEEQLKAETPKEPTEEPKTEPDEADNATE